VPLGEEPITIGRDPSCTIRLQSRYVSRQHARIEIQDGVPTLVDLGSHNGSLLNGVRVAGAAPLSGGDVITIATAPDATATIECVAQPVTAEMTRTLAVDSIPGAGGSPAAPSPAAQPDTLSVDVQIYEVRIGGRLLERRLSAQEFQLLSYLYERRDRVCTRQELGDAIWGKDNWDTNMLHRLVHRLKEKIEPAPETPRYVQTVPWVGYRCTA
jgi:hypothetical protein